MRVYLEGRELRPGTLRVAFRNAVLEQLGPLEPLEGAVVLRLRFVFKRPPGELAPVPIAQVSVRALAGVVLDELAGIAYRDERQLVAVHAQKEYGNANVLEARW